MKITFLWRENYVGYLWASSVTAKSYFVHSGILAYQNEVLSAYATELEIKKVKKMTEAISNNPAVISNYKKNFKQIKDKTLKFEKKINTINLSKITSRRLYALFENLILILNEYIKAYSWTEAHFLSGIENELYSAIAKKKFIKKSTAEIIAQLLAHKSKKLYQQYKITDQEHLLLNTVNSAARMRFQAKKTMTNLANISETLMREVARRSYLAVSQVSQLELNQLKKLLCQEVKPNLEIINHRQKNFAFMISNKYSIRTLTNRQANAIKQYEQKQTKTKKIHGFVVYPGKVTGRARIVPPLFSQEDYRTYIKSLQPKDIIIAPMTSPYLTPAFSKVAAVITDEGGLMSHAALIAREKRIPCIIGTLIATKTFNEGDRITVDANTGTINK